MKIGDRPNLPAAETPQSTGGKHATRESAGVPPGSRLHVICQTCVISVVLILRAFTDQVRTRACLASSVGVSRVDQPVRDDNYKRTRRRSFGWHPALTFQPSSFCLAPFAHDRRVAFFCITSSRQACAFHALVECRSFNILHLYPSIPIREHAKLCLASSPKWHSTHAQSPHHVRGRKVRRSSFDI